MSQFQPGRGPYEQVPRRFSKWELIASQIFHAAETRKLLERVRWVQYACSLLDENERKFMELDSPHPWAVDKKETLLQLLDRAFVELGVDQGYLDQLIAFKLNPPSLIVDERGRTRRVTAHELLQHNEAIRSYLKFYNKVNRIVGVTIEKLARYAEGQGVRVSVPASILGPDGRPIARTILKGDSVQFPAEDQEKPQQDKKPHEDK